MNQPSSLNHLLPLNRNTPARRIVSSCLAGRFFVVQRQVLGRTFICTFGETSGFFVGVQLNSRFLFEVAMLTFDQYESLLFSQAGSPFVRRGLAYFPAYSAPQLQPSSFPAQRVRMTNSKRIRSSVRLAFRDLSRIRGSLESGVFSQVKKCFKLK